MRRPASRPRTEPIRERLVQVFTRDFYMVYRIAARVGTGESQGGRRENSF
jgi:hypothetical protein